MIFPGSVTLTPRKEKAMAAAKKPVSKKTTKSGAKTKGKKAK
jgi:hypothetical protein